MTLRHLKPKHTMIKRQRPVQVSHLEMHVANLHSPDEWLVVIS